MGTGDWNDGMNRVGIQGHGESVWLGWFLYSVLKHLRRFATREAESEQASAYEQQADRLQTALEQQAGMGSGIAAPIMTMARRWAQRKIWSARSTRLRNRGRCFPVQAIPRIAQAMSAVAERLVRPEDQLLLLFTPPFDKTAHDPGYIKGYPPGIRENGGQYTHAALWTVWAFANLGHGNQAGELFRLLNPISHSDTPEKAEKYRVDPYVIAADVYSVAPHIGRGGWTWYTGSASWMYRLGIEAILGLKRKGNRLQIDPCIPDDWPDYEATYRDGETVYNIHVHNPQGVNRGVIQITLDGNIISEGFYSPAARRRAT